MKKILSVFVFSLIIHISFGQPICGFDANHKRLMSDPVYAEKMRLSEQQIQQFIRANPVLPKPLGIGTALYQIPVVVHVVHTGGAIGTTYNPSDSQILSVIDYLNQVYDGSAAGFSGGAGDIQIQFVPAKRDPNCNPSNGIDRVNGAVLPGYTAYGVMRHGANGVSDAELKDQSRWDPSRYYNVWSVNKIDGKDGSSGQFVAGYSAFAGSDPSVDGAVILTSQMHVGETVLPHEMGHALNLFHPFQGSSHNADCPTNNNCNTDGDRVCDTDPITYNATVAGVVTFTCRTGTNSCTGTPYSPNTESNVMNYTRCFTRFTAGQKTRMIAAMSLPSRSSLAASSALLPTYSGAVPCPPKINFELAQSTVTESTTSSANCLGYKDYTYQFIIGNSPNATATATLVATGTAQPGIDYLFTTNGSFSSTSNTVSFPVGVHDNRSFTIRVFDDAAIESDETIILNYTVNSGGGNAVKGELTPVLTIILKSNDITPQPTVAQQAKIGTYTTNLGSTSAGQPFDVRIISKKTTFLYKASELTAMGLSAGNVTSIGVYLDKNSVRAFTNLQVKMGATSLEYLVDGSANLVPVSTVKSLASYNSVNGLNLFALDVPFTWNGSSNIAVQVCYDNGSTASAESNDICQGYSDGGLSSQGNMYWQNGINCTAAYTSVTNFSEGRKPVGYFVIGLNGPQVESLQNATGSAYLGPYDSVYFYSANGNVLARIKNLGAFDYGCTQVIIDRAGNTSKAYINNTAAEAVADKTIRVIPTNNSPSGTYEITLFYKAAEVQGWKSATGQNWANAKILKTPNAVTAYTPGQVPQGIVETSPSLVSNYGADSSITASFSTGFSGFAVGNPTLALPLIYTFTGNGLWTNAANWSNNTIPPGVLPSGAQIIINPATGGQCILNTAQTIQPGASLTVNSFKNFVVQGNISVVQ